MVGHAAGGRHRRAAAGDRAAGNGVPPHGIAQRPQLTCLSFNELRRDGFDAERWNRLNPEAKTPRKAYVTELLEGRQGPAIAATDYVRAYADQIRAFVTMAYTVLGTDGFGRSDTRANLCRHFELDRHYIAHAAIAALAKEGKMTAKDVSRAIKRYKIDVEKANPVGVQRTPCPVKKAPNRAPVFFFNIYCSD